MAAFYEDDKSHVRPNFKVEHVDMVAIEFDDFTGAPKYDKLMEQSHMADDFQTAGSGDDIRYRTTYNMDVQVSVEQCFLQLELIRSIERELKRDRKEFRPHTIRVDGKAVVFDETHEPSLRCYRDYLDSYDRSVYCRGKEDDQNEIGCFRGGLYEFGKPNLGNFGELKGKIFVVDKNKLRKHVFTNLEKFRFCPRLKLENVEKAIDEMNTTINPETNAYWDYIYDEKNNPIGIQRVKDKDKRKKARDPYEGLPGCLKPVIAMLGGFTAILMIILYFLF